MPRAIPVPVRRNIWQRWCRGQSTADIAHALSLPRRTVRALLARFRRRPDDGLRPDYRPPATLPHATPPHWRDDAVRLRQQHPRWGAGYIRVVLAETYPDRRWPAVRTLQRWFRRAGLAPAPPGRRRGAPRQRAQRPHQVWQIDASELIRLASGEQVSWLRLIDECTGAVLQTAVSPPRALESGATGLYATAAAAGLRPLGTARRAAL